LDGRQVKVLGIHEIVKRLRGWNPLQPVLVGAPNSETFVPPPKVPELAATFHAFQKRSEKALIALLIGSALLFAAWFTSPRQAPPLYVLTMLLGVIAGVDYMVYLRHESYLSQRAQFYYWLHVARKPRFGFAVWVSVAILMGASQLLVQSACGGFEEAVTRYGALFEPIRNGELWRLLTGPFFHSGIPHYANNALSLTFIGVVAWVLVGPWSIAVFLIGNVIAAAAQMQFGAAGFDSYVGVSGGVFALYGLVASIGVLKPDTFPKGFTLLCVLIAVATAIGGELLVPHAGSIGHLAGAIAGICCGIPFNQCRR
jgi:membrane associated rhomboid family serine protease